MNDTDLLHSIHEKLDKHVAEEEGTILELTDKVTTISHEFHDFKADFTELLDILRAGKGFFKVMGWIGKGIAFLAAILAPLGAAWAYINHWPDK